MAPTLASSQLADRRPPTPGAAPPGGRAPAGPADETVRDWAEIQERMLVPLYEAVYERLEVGYGTRLLGVGCGSGLALLMAAARGAAVTGVDRDERRLQVARTRLLPDPRVGAPRRPAAARLVRGGPEAARQPGGAYTVVTAFGPASTDALGAAAGLAERGSPVVVAGWGPPERCATARVLGMADHPPLAPDAPGALPATVPVPPVGRRDDLEELARDAGLRPDGSGRVACPFAYPDMDSAVRGLVSTGLLPAAAEDDSAKERAALTEALRPYRRRDGSVRMDNVFRYVIARV